MGRLTLVGVAAGSGVVAAPSAPFWRIADITSDDGSLFGMRQIIMRESYGGANVATTGNGSATSSAISGTSPDNALDSTVTYFEGDGGAGSSWWQIEYGVARAILEVELVTHTAVAQNVHMPRSFLIQYSPDGVTFTTLTTITNVLHLAWLASGTANEPERRVYWTDAGPTTGAPRFFRLNVTLSNDPSWTNLREMEYRAVAGVGGSLATGGVVVDNRPVSAVNTPAKAYDANASTEWESFGIPSLLIYDMGAGTGMSPVEAALTTGTFPTEGPKDFTVAWSRSGWHWTTAHTASGIVGWSSGTYKTFALAGVP